MNYLTKRLFILVAFSFMSATLFAQYGDQFANRGFEDWTSRGEKAVSEPVHWHSGGTASGWLSGTMPNTMEQSSQTRPGSTGSKSIRLVPKSVVGVTANGSVTNGRINAGSMSPSGSSNYNYTQRAQSAFNTPMTMIPDSITVWACFRSQSSSDKARVRAVVHGDADFRLVSDGTDDPANMVVAGASIKFTRTSTANGEYVWRRLSTPFDVTGPCTDIRYLLMFATTNETAGSGSTNDDLFLDDFLLIYNPSLTMGQLAYNDFMPNDVLTIPFTLTGTMSPDNLNAAANEVIAQMSDANGNFNNPMELGRVTTNTSGNLSVHIPEVADGNYKIRVVSTNYPMIGQNIQQISITTPKFTVTATANPADGGTITGADTYNFGATCTLTATANEGYSFTNWTENGEVVSTDPSFSFVVTGMINLVANFSINTYSIAATANPAAGGTVDGVGDYQYGTSCTLTASANEGYTFTNWTENGTEVSTNANYTFTVGGGRDLVANFTINTYNIAVVATPADGGMVDGAGDYQHGASCTLTASANPGFDFIGWTKDDEMVSSEANITFTVTASATYIAVFGFDDIVKENMTNCHIFPNPFGSTITVKAEKRVHNVSVFDVTGRLLRKQAVSKKEFTIDLSDLSPGTYMLQLDYGNSKSVHRIMRTE